MVLRGCLVSLALFGLTGCENISNRVAGLNASANATNEGIRTLAMLDGNVRVRGPEGYCVDQSASDSRNGFAVLAGCALLSETAAVMPQLDGLITVQFGEEDSASVVGNEDVFAAFLASDSGRGILSANGEGTALSDVTTVSDRSGVIVHFNDTAGTGFPGTDSEQWRGFVDVKGRLVTVSVLNFDRNDLSSSERERLLVVAMAQVLEVNATAQPQSDAS